MFSSKGHKYKHVVCAIAKNETRYLLEWVAYHLAIGFDHIYLYDNMSDQPIEDTFNDHALKNYVTVIRWPRIADEDQQLSAYVNFHRTFRHDTEWVMVLDLDEFLCVKGQNHVSALTQRYPHADGISINWRIFGSDGENVYRPAPMLSRFTKCSTVEFKANCNIKTIHRTEKLTTLSLHHGLYTDEGIVVSADGSDTRNEQIIPPRASNFDIAQVNHYFVKSREEWIWKNQRGYTDGTVRPADAFAQYDQNEVEDSSLLGMTKQVAAISRLISSRPEKGWSFLGRQLDRLNLYRALKGGGQRVLMG